MCKRPGARTGTTGKRNRSRVEKDFFLYGLTEIDAVSADLLRLGVTADGKVSIAIQGDGPGDSSKRKSAGPATNRDAIRHSGEEEGCVGEKGSVRRSYPCGRIVASPLPVSMWIAVRPSPRLAPTTLWPDLRSTASA
jgi:hypothetical protein